MSDAWFSALGKTLRDEERSDVAAYLAALRIRAPIRTVDTWQEAGELCRQRSDEWWNAEEGERLRLERTARLDPADRQWLALNEALHAAAAHAAERAGCTDSALIYAAAGAASHAAYHARLAYAAGAPADHPFARKYVLYRGGRWPLGLYGGEFRIF